MNELSVHGIALELPEGFRTEIKAKSRVEAGKIALIGGPRIDAGERVILVQWQDRGEKGSRNLKDKVEQDYAFLRSRRDVDTVELKKDVAMEICGHEAVYRSALVRRSMNFLFVRRSTEMTLESVHLYCDTSNRFITFFRSSVSDIPEMDGKVEAVARSLRCH